MRTWTILRRFECYTQYTCMLYCCRCLHAVSMCAYTRANWYIERHGNNSLLVLLNMHRQMRHPVSSATFDVIGCLFSSPLVAKSMVNAQDRNVAGGRTPVHIATLIGNSYLVATLIAAGADINVCRLGTSNTSPLHCSTKNPVILAMLITAGADVNATDSSNRSVLHYAASTYTGAYESASPPCSIHQLASAGALLLARDASGCTAMHDASPAAVALLSGLSPSLLNLKNHHGLTPLMFAARYQYPLHGAHKCLALLCNGADIHETDLELRTALHYTMHPETTEVLSVHGADLHAPDIDGSTPLHLSVWHREPAVTRRLVELGADPLQRNHDGMLPLHLAAMYGCLQNAEVLLCTKLREQVATRAYGQVGNTPLHIAASYSLPVAELIMSVYGQSAASLLNDMHEVPVHLAATANMAYMLLTAAPHTINTRNISGNSPTHAAAQRGNPGVLGVLLKLGCRVNAINDKKQTPLIYAIMSESIPCINMLVDYNAFVSFSDAYGLTPRCYANMSKHAAILCSALQAVTTDLYE